MESLRQELEKERSRCSELEQKINDILRSRWASFECGVIFVSDHLCGLTPPQNCRSPHSLEDSPIQRPKVPPPPQPPAASSKGEEQKLIMISDVSRCGTSLSTDLYM